MKVYNVSAPPDQDVSVHSTSVAPSSPSRISTSLQNWPLLCPLPLGECLINKIYFLEEAQAENIIFRRLRVLIVLGCWVCPLLWGKKSSLAYSWWTSLEFVFLDIILTHLIPTVFNGKQVFSFTVVVSVIVCYCFD